MRSCFAGLADGLRDHLADDSEHVVLFDYHRHRIAEVFASQPDLPLHQDSAAGFLHGFLTTIAHLIPADGVQQQTTFPILGGTLLLGRDLPVPDAATTAGHAFTDRLAAILADHDAGSPTDAAIDLVRGAFEIAGDVPVTCAALGAFCLGVLYASPWLPDHTDPTPLLAAACHLALHLR